MKSVSVYPVVRLALVMGVLVGVAQVGFAADETNNGELSRYLAQKMFCDTADLLQGDIGLLIGLILVFVGIWSMVQGAKAMAAVPVMIMGAFITAIPSLIMSSMEGLGGLLKETGISKNEFTPPECPPLEPNQIVSRPNQMGPFLPTRNIKGSEGLAVCKTNPSDPRC